MNYTSGQGETIRNYVLFTRRGNNVCALHFESWKTIFGRVVRNDGTKKLTTGLFEKKKSGMRDGQSCRKSQGKWRNVWHLKEESIFFKKRPVVFFSVMFYCVLYMIIYRYAHIALSHL